MNRVALAIILSLLALLFAVAYASSPRDDSGSCGLNLTWSFNSTSYTLIISGTGNMTDFSNWQEIPWLPVRLSVSEIVINEGVTSIGNLAFYNCHNLTSVMIPSSVSLIGQSSFEGCKKLSSVSIPEGVLSIGSSVFSNCESMTSISILHLWQILAFMHFNLVSN